MEAPPPGSAELVERLAAIGLEEKDALLYIHLCVYGPSKASDVAVGAKLNRTEAYRALDNLIRRGFVTASLDRPTLYEATQPEKVFDDALAHHHARHASIERARDVALTSLAQLRAREAGGPLKASYKMLQGRAAIFALLEGMVRRARLKHDVVSTFFGPKVATDGNTLYQTTLRRTQEGLPMRLLARESPGYAEGLAEILTHAHVHARFFDPPTTMRFNIVDDREVLVWLVSDPAPGLAAKDDVAMWTNAPDFVAQQRVLCDLLWRDARPMPRPKS